MLISGKFWKEAHWQTLVLREVIIVMTQKCENEIFPTSLAVHILITPAVSRKTLAG